MNVEMNACRKEHTIEKAEGVIPPAFYFVLIKEIPAQYCRCQKAGQAYIKSPSGLPRQCYSRDAINGFRHSGCSLKFPLRIRERFRQPVFRHHDFPSFYLFYMPAVSADIVKKTAEQCQSSFLFSFL